MIHLTHTPTHPSQWRPLDSRFAQLEARLTQHRRWLEKETQSQVQDFAEIERHRKKYIRCLKGLTRTGVNGDGELETQRVARRLKRIEKARHWISDGPHLDQETTSCPQDAGSSDWFFSSIKYRRWKEMTFDQARANDTGALNSDWHDRVLFVQGRSINYELDKYGILRADTLQPNQASARHPLLRQPSKDFLEKPKTSTLPASHVVRHSST